MGRPTKLNAERQERICEAIRDGCHLELAARLGGVSYFTFRNWMVRGEEARKDSAYFQFFQAVTRAQDEAEAGLVAIISRAAAGTEKVAPEWRAAEVLLKRRWPERWGNTMRVTGAEGGPVQVTTREAAVKDGKERSKHLRAV